MTKACVLKAATIKELNTAKSNLYRRDSVAKKFTDDDTIFLALKLFNEVQQHARRKKSDSKFRPEA